MDALHCHVAITRISSETAFKVARDRRANVVSSRSRSRLSEHLVPFDPPHTVEQDRHDDGGRRRAQGMLAELLPSAKRLETDLCDVVDVCSANGSRKRSAPRSSRTKSRSSSSRSIHLPSHATVACTPAADLEEVAEEELLEVQAAVGPTQRAAASTSTGRDRSA